MKGSKSELDSESWAFALRIYARPGVADACLALQSEAGVDVMVLLMAAFAAVKHRIVLTGAEIKALDDVCRPWREQIVWPLRVVRTGLKTGPSPAPSEETEPFRAQVKALELAAERLENKLLAECLSPKLPGQDTVTAGELRAVLADVVTLFASQRGTKGDARFSSLVEAIAEAAMQDASRFSP